MSMNLYVQGNRKATVLVKGKKKTIKDTTDFKLWQTPTVLTNEVLAMSTTEAKVEAYVKWADSVTKPYEDNVYDYTGDLDDDFNYPVVGTKMVYPAQDHANELREWLRMCDDEDYTVEFYSL
jgi:hypothetical protein